MVGMQAAIMPMVPSRLGRGGRSLAGLITTEKV